MIEDAAQSFSSRLRGKHVGTIGDVGVFSFGMYKNLNTFLGGMLVTSREDLIKDLSDEMFFFPLQDLSLLLKKIGHSLITDVATYPPIFSYIVYQIFRFGFLNDVEFLNKRVRVEDYPRTKDKIPPEYLQRISPMQARIGLQNLSQIEDDNKARMVFAKKYFDGLKDLQQLLIPPWREDGSHIYSYYAIQCRDRHPLVRHMMMKGCDVAIQHIKNCADLECFKKFYRDCPNARATGSETILLPTFITL